MARENFGNFAKSTLNGDISAGATTIPVTSASSFPAAPFRIAIDSEIFLVTAVSGNNLTVTPGYEGSTQATHTSGAGVRHTITAGSLSTLDSTYVRFDPTGNNPRTVSDRLTDWISIKDYGAIGDGTTHPLSSRFGSLSAAQAVYPHAVALTDEIDWCAIQAAVNTGKFGINFPEGTYRINRTITLRSLMHWRGAGTGVYSNGTKLQRTADINMIQGVGVSTLVSGGAPSLSRVCFDDMIFEGGGFGSSTSIMDLKACYEFFFDNVRWTGVTGSWLRCSELMDSRFRNNIWTFGGTRDGTIAGLRLQSTEFTPGFETCNNLYFYGNRWESNPGVSMRIEGTNSVDFWFSHCKWESVGQLDYLVVLDRVNGGYFDSCWQFVRGDNYGNLTWNDAVSSVTASTSVKNFTIATSITQIYNNMSMMAVDTTNPLNWMSGRCTTYTSSTGAVLFTPDYISPTANTTASTSWNLSPMHPGLMYLTGCNSCGGNIIGGQGGTNPGIDVPIMKSFIHCNNGTNIRMSMDVTQGTANLPANTFMALHATSSSNTISAGQKTFTVEANRSVASGDILYIQPRSFSNNVNSMTGHVQSYDSTGGVLIVNVDPGQISGSLTATNWLLTPYTTNLVTMTGTNRGVQFQGGGQTYGRALAINPNPVADIYYNNMHISRYGTPELIQRNNTTQDRWHMGDVVNDRSTIGSLLQNTGKYRFYVEDIARGTNKDIWSVDGRRNLVISSPMSWIDGAGTFTRIVGNALAAPTTGVYLRNDIVLNSAMANDSPLGWVAISASSADGTTVPAVFSPFAIINSTGGGGGGGGVGIPFRQVTASGSITTSSADNNGIVEIKKTTPAATTVNLHASPATGTRITFTDGGDNANTYPVTFIPAAGLIVGDTQLLVNAAGFAITLYYNGTSWRLSS